MPLPYADRRAAGRALAEAVRHRIVPAAPIVLALPRGSVSVAFEVAQALHGELDVMLVRKLGVPGHEEMAMGAIASGGVRVLNEDVVRELAIDEASIERVATREQDELLRRERLYREGRPPPPVEGRQVILVDDGLATGATMRAAVQALRAQRPASLVVAVPVASAEACAEFRDEVDEIVCAETPTPFRGVGLWYRNFAPTSDAEVRELLARAERARHRARAVAPRGPGGGSDYDR